ncbi:MAG: hypothetical protein QT05_C0031G0007 [archaeon GW2011_AR13]|nr:MAG: hypothetical protein QT05_C0031G0007 [archaeon GW2011_AR13]
MKIKFIKFKDTIKDYSPVVQRSSITGSGEQVRERHLF